MIKENILDPVREDLSGQVWDDMKLKKEVSDQILLAIKPITDKYEVDSVIFIGSMTGYQYNEYSDIDIHVRVDNATEDELNDMFDSIENGINLKGTEHPINYYFYSGSEFEGKHEKGSAYDVINNSWIYPPKKEDVEIPYSYLMEIAKVFMAGIDERIREYEMDSDEVKSYEEYLKYAKENEKEDIENKITQKKLEVEADLDGLQVIQQMIYKMRTGAYEGEQFDLFVDMGKGNLSVQNAVFKILEKSGYKEKLKKYDKIRKDLKRKIMEAYDNFPTSFKEMMKEDEIEGGLGDDRSDSDFDSEQLKKGIKIEMEHTKDPKLAKEIAKDHLTENPYYYDDLEEMEDEYEDMVKDFDNEMKDDIPKPEPIPVDFEITNVSFDDFKLIVMRNFSERVEFTNDNDKMDFGSFSELLFANQKNWKSIQSINIKMGGVLENSWNDLISLIEKKNPNIHNTLENKRKVKDKNVQIDISFIKGNELHYYESKNNINLDTEKTPATFNKVRNVEEQLKSVYEKLGFVIITGVLSNRYPDTKSMGHFKGDHKDKLIGYNDLFNILGIKGNFQSEWEKLFSDIGDIIVKELKVG